MSAIAWIGEPTYTKDNFVRVREGDRIGPYRIVKIREDRVELTGPTGPLVVRPQRVRAGRGPAAVRAEQSRRWPRPSLLRRRFRRPKSPRHGRAPEEWKALYPSQGFNRLLEGLKRRGESDYVVEPFSPRRASRSGAVGNSWLWEWL